MWQTAGGTSQPPPLSTAHPGAGEGTSSKRSSLPHPHFLPGVPKNQITRPQGFPRSGRGRGCRQNLVQVGAGLSKSWTPVDALLPVRLCLCPLAPPTTLTQGGTAPSIRHSFIHWSVHSFKRWNYLTKYLCRCLSHTSHGRYPASLLGTFHISLATPLPMVLTLSVKGREVQHGTGIPTLCWKGQPGGGAMGLGPRVGRSRRPGGWTAGRPPLPADVGRDGITTW